MVIFGGDGEDRVDPKDVEVMWPGYDDGFDDSGYVTIGDFDPVPDILEQNFASLQAPRPFPSSISDTLFGAGGQADAY